MAKVIRYFKSKDAARDFIKSSRERFKCINYGSVYQAAGHYHVMLTGDITPEVAEQLKGKTEKGFIFEP